MTREPALISGLVAAVVQAILAVLIAFGVDMSDAQTAAILGLSGALLAVVSALFTRSRVSPVG